MNSLQRTTSIFTLVLTIMCNTLFASTDISLDHIKNIQTELTTAFGDNHPFKDYLSSICRLLILRPKLHAAYYSDPSENLAQLLEENETLLGEMETIGNILIKKLTPRNNDDANPLDYNGIDSLAFELGMDMKQGDNLAERVQQMPTIPPYPGTTFQQQPEPEEESNKWLVRAAQLGGVIVGLAGIYGLIRLLSER